MVRTDEPQVVRRVGRIDAGQGQGTPLAAVVFDRDAAEIVVAFASDAINVGNAVERGGSAPLPPQGVDAVRIPAQAADGAGVGQWVAGGGELQVRVVHPLILRI